MATLTIRLPDDKYERLKELAQARGISVNKLMEKLSTTRSQNLMPIPDSRQWQRLATQKQA